MPRYVMSDGRAFTNYAPNCDLIKALQTKYNISNSNELRSFMQKNMEQVKADIEKLDGDKQSCAVCPVCKEAVDYKP